MSSTPVSKYLFDKLAEEAKASTPRDHIRNKIDKCSTLLEYSLLDGQVMPPSVDSSPDIELQHRKLFSKGISPLASNITLLNNYVSEEESDESFVRMERLIRGPFKSDICDSNKPKVVPETLESKTETIDNTNEVSPSNKKSINMSSLIDGFNLLRVNASSSFKQSTSVNSFNDSLDISPKDKKENISNLNNVPVLIMEEDSLENNKNETFEVDPDESLKFNDTLEEMDYYLKQGAKKFVAEEPKKTAIPIVQEKIKEIVPTPTKGHVHTTRNPEIYVNDKSLKPTPVNKKVPRIFTLALPKNPKTFSPRNKTPIQKLQNPDIHVNDKSQKPTPINRKVPRTLTLSQPKKSENIFSPRTNTPKLKMENFDKKFTPNRKYDDIKSPIGHYINHSPTVPLLKNVSPAKNYWDRVPREPLNRSSRLYKNTGKENAHLPEKAYKSSKATKVIERPTVGRLPQGNKITTMMENTPKVLVIKHIKREQLSNLPLNCNDNKTRGVEDSFAHLPVDCGDVSHCIVNPVTRTKTLK